MKLVSAMFLGMALSAAPLSVTGTGPSQIIPAAEAAQKVRLSGWLHVIWNGKPRFILVDDQGRQTRLLVDEQLLAGRGGPRAFNRKRVTIEGNSESDLSNTVRVIAIEVQ